MLLYRHHCSRLSMRVSLNKLFLVLSVLSSQAVILFDSSDPNHNTTAPTGALANSGWHLQGQWGNFLGTPISPNHFIAATHVGGTIGQTFTINGVAHTTTATFADPNSDLTIWQVTPPFRDWARLYTNNTEIGKRFVVFGRGTQRGAPIEVGGPLTPVTKGWLWGPYDMVQRWGENTIEDVLDTDGNPHSVIISGIVAVGPLLRATFDPSNSTKGGPNEAALSAGDSSGAIFINDGSTWRLAGINYAVDGPYNTSPVGPGFMGAIFDEGGLYKGGENKWILTPDLPAPQGGAFFATRISQRFPWIRTIIGDPGFPSTTPVLEFTTELNGPFAEDNAATFDPTNIIFRTPNPNQQRFFRIRATQPIEIIRLTLEGSDLLLTCRYR
jgi:hypothetical protein